MAVDNCFQYIIENLNNLNAILIYILIIRTLINA
jgi:hypothetical protein